VTALLERLHLGHRFIKEKYMTSEGIWPVVDAQKLDLLDPNTLIRLAASAQEEIRRRGLRESGRPPKAARIFQVPDSVKYLSAAQLETLASAFRAWLQAARDERSRQSRTRMWLLFLLLRHTGMRLGEALELDDRSDIDLVRGE
jgi:molybdate transport system regulatory protein